MAQVVQRRGTPAYLVVVFVILFVISSALAVVFYVKWDEDSKKLVEAQDALSTTKKELTKVSNTTVPDLIRRITVVGGDNPQVAIDAAAKALEAPYANAYSNTGLVGAIDGLAKQLAAKEAEVQKITGERDNKDKVITERDAAITKIKSDWHSQVQAVRQELATAQAAFTRDLTAKDAQLDRAVKDKDDIIDRRETEKAVLAQKVDELDLKVQNLNTRNKILTQKIREMKDTADVRTASLLQYDGKIAKALPEQQIIFIDLGERDNVRPGLPFAVYDKNKGVSEEGKGKAKLVVVNVHPTTSECRIVESTPDNPITEGDLVANLVFNTHRVHQFVVEGEFDLYGEGRVDPLGNRRIRGMIEDYGGKLAEAVSVDTDFVVMGEEPVAPSKPSEDASPADWRIYTEQRGRYDRYKQIQAFATSLQIPVLSTSRFLSFSGFVPKKRLTD